MYWYVVSYVAVFIVTDDSGQEFNYENVADVVKHLSTDGSGSLPCSKPTTPKPLPRVRSPNEPINR